MHGMVGRGWDVDLCAFDVITLGWLEMLGQYLCGVVAFKYSPVIEQAIAVFFG